MSTIQRKEIDNHQPAIDTECDNCGAIYDLMDCITYSYGTILCPDCYGEISLRNTSIPDRSMLPNYNVVSITDQRNIV